MSKSFTAKGLRNRLIRQITWLVMVVIATGIGGTSLVLTRVISQQLEGSLEAIGHEYLRDLDLYFTFMDETIERFSKNQLVVNSLIEPEGRDLSLPQLAREFSLSSFVVDLAVVDFAGKQIYRSSEGIAVPPDHPNLRKALASESRTIQFQEQDLYLQVIQPVLYYETTQGAVVVTLDMGAMLRDILSSDSTRVFRVYNGNTLLMTFNEQPGETYVNTRHIHDQDGRHLYVQQLDLALEIGVMQEEYRRPLQDTILPLFLFSLFFLILAVLVGWRIGDQLAKPILRLCEKVQQSGSRGEGTPCSPVGTNDELEALAIAFDERTSQLIVIQSDLQQNNERLKREIGQRQEAEASLQAAYGDLEEKILERTRELHAAKESLDKAQEIASLGNWDWDIAADTLWWSDEIFRIFGLDPQSFIPTYKKFMEVIHPEDREVVTQAVTDAQINHRPYRVEHRVVLPDGRERYVLEQGELQVDSGGTPLRMVGTVLDINERKEAEEALRESEEKFSKAFKSAPIMMAISDLLDGTLLEINDCFVECTGFSREEAIGRSPMDLGCYSKEYREPMLQEILAKGQLSRKELLFRKKNGEVMVCSYSGELLNVGGTRRLFSIAEDITERKEIELLLKQDEERLSSLLSLSQRAWESEDALTSFALEEAVRLTDSDVGYLHFINQEDDTIELYAWSHNVQEQCSAAKTSHYPVASAGIWADSVRTKKPVIHNDYQGLSEKQGVPEGHFLIRRHMSIPVFDQDSVVAVIGVGNKEGPYGDQDIRQLTLFMSSMWQILKRKRVEDELFYSRQMLQGILDNIPQRVFWKDRQGNYLGANRLFLQDAGVDSVEEIVGKGDCDMPWQEQAEQYQADDQAVMESSSPKLNIEEPQQKADGAFSWAITNKIPLQDKDGHVYGILGTYEDISDRKQAEVLLQEAEERYRTLFEQSPDGIVLVDAESLRSIAFNEAAHRQLGYEKEEFADLRVNDYEINESPEETARHIKQILETGQDVFETRHRCKNGEIRNVIVTTKALTIGGSQVFLAIFRDFTLLKRAEEEVKLKAKLVDAANDSIFLHDLEGHILEANEAAWKSRGYGSKGAFLPKNIKDLDIPEFAESIPQRMQEMQAEGYCMFESAHICTDGSVLPIDVAAKFIEVGGEKMVLSVARDIRARKEAEAKLKQFTRELERSNKELQQFAYVASHDLQEPLRKILAFGDRLKSHGAGSLDERSLDYLERMQNAAGRMRHLIESLLQFSRVTTKGKPLQIVSLQEVVAEVLADLEELLLESNGKIDVGKLPQVRADRMQMHQLFQNLLVNALRYQAPGQEPHVTVSSKETVDSGWEIMVSDNGIGFDEKYLERIFMPFQRLHARDEYEGTGMGLAICEKIVKRHDGTITARSREGQGATFIISLPSHLEEGGREHES